MTGRRNIHRSPVAANLPDSTGLARRPNRVRSIIIPCLVGFLFSASIACGQESLADVPEFRNGCVELEKGDFAKGTVTFSEIWDSVSKAETDDISLNLVASRLLECLVRGNQSAEAVTWIRKNRDAFTPSRPTALWIARALKEQELFTDAIRHYEAFAKPEKANPHIVSEYAYCLARNGEPLAGLEALDAAFPAKSDSERMIRSRLALQAGEVIRAGEEIAPILEKLDQLPNHLQLDVMALNAQCLATTGDPSSLVLPLMDWIENVKTPTLVYRGFDLLQRVAAPASRETILAKLDQWKSNHEQKPVQIAAEYYSILLKGDRPEADALKKFLSAHENHPLSSEARLQLADVDPKNAARWLTPTMKARPEAESLFSANQRKAAYQLATSRFQEKSYQQAVSAFEKSAEGSGGVSQRRAWHNAALAALSAGDDDRYDSLRKRLLLAGPSDPASASLLFLSGLQFASKGSPRAFDVLEQFVQRFPDHPSLPEAQLARAEVYLNQVPPRPQSARKILDKLRLSPLSLDQAERLDYTAIWTESIDQNSAELIRLGKKFSSDWPNSALLHEITMLIAAEYFSMGEQKDARALFREIPEQYPDSPFAAPARFFATKAAPPAESTVDEWTTVITDSPDFAQAARHEKALVLLKLSRYAEAREVLEELIAEEQEDSEIKFAAMCDLGYAWFLEALANNKDRVMLGAAANAFGKLSRTPEASNAWKFEAAVRRAKCIEKLGNDAVALEIYRSIVDSSHDSSLLFGADSPIRETAWLYRAGFAALRILEEKKDWAGAIKVADALSRKDGSRSIEAARLADRLRLKHWVWE